VLGEFCAQTAGEVGRGKAVVEKRFSPNAGEQEAGKGTPLRGAGVKIKNWGNSPRSAVQKGTRSRVKHPIKEPSGGKKEVTPARANVRNLGYLSKGGKLAPPSDNQRRHSIH